MSRTGNTSSAWRRVIWSVAASGGPWPRGEEDEQSKVKVKVVVDTSKDRLARQTESPRSTDYVVPGSSLAGTDSWWTRLYGLRPAVCTLPRGSTQQPPNEGEAKQICVCKRVRREGPSDDGRRRALCWEARKNSNQGKQGSGGAADEGVDEGVGVNKEKAEAARVRLGILSILSTSVARSIVYSFPAR